MPSQKVFHLGCPVVAVLEADHLWRCAASVREVEKIGISGYDSEPVGPGILPYGLVRSEPRQPRVENVDRIGKELGKSANEPGRKICVK